MPSARDAIIAAELGGGYRRVPHPLRHFRPLTNQVVVQEHLTTFSQHLILLKKQNTIYGTVLAVGDQAQDEDGLQVGDTVIYTEWQGGRWCFPDPGVDDGEVRVIILTAYDIQAIVRAEDAANAAPVQDEITARIASNHAPQAATG